MQFPISWRFIKFAFVGAINTLVDLGVLTVLLFVLGTDWSPYSYPILKSVSFLVAVVNSYAWNRKWVFKQQGTTTKTEAVSFLLVSLIGILLNTLIATGVFWLGLYIWPQVNVVMLGDVAGVVGTLCVMLSNYFGYKYLVFRAKSNIDN